MRMVRGLGSGIPELGDAHHLPVGCDCDGGHWERRAPGFVTLGWGGPEDYGTSGRQWLEHDWKVRVRVCLRKSTVLVPLF